MSATCLQLLLMLLLLLGDRRKCSGAWGRVRLRVVCVLHLLLQLLLHLGVWRRMALGC